MKTYELFIEEDGCTWLTGELIRTPDPLRQGDTKWEVYWEGGNFVFYGGKHQLKAMLSTMSINLIIGKEVTQ
jgi:hypothetical protein